MREYSCQICKVEDELRRKESGKVNTVVRGEIETPSIDGYTKTRTKSRRESDLPRKESKELPE